MPTPRTGEQFGLAAQSARATVTAVGAGLRELTVAGRPILTSFDEDTLAPGGAGQVLAPWPNRLEDGSYSFGDCRATVPLNEPVNRNAIHGLVRWLHWEPIAQRPDAVTLACVLAAQPAYPWPLRLELDYLLAPTALSVTVRAHNLGVDPAPFGVGFHPYLAAAPAGLDEGRLLVPATVRLRADDRGLPVGREEIEMGRLTSNAVTSTLAGVVLDDCFGGLVRGADGSWRVRFEPLAGEGPAVEVFADAHFDYVMCFTADTLDPSRRRGGVAIEPMTCAPNAFRSGDGLITLQPDHPFSASWGISFAP